MTRGDRTGKKWESQGSGYARQMPTESARDREEHALWRILFMSMIHLLNTVEADVKADSDLTLLDLGTLFVLAHAEHGRPMGQVAALFGVDPSVITYRVKRLEDRGYATRSPSPTDRRVTHAHITGPGRDALRASRAAMLASARTHLFAHLEPGDLPALHAALGHLYAGQRGPDDGTVR
jgi:DNA-binding MarR family transcriptional regulator